MDIFRNEYNKWVREHERMPDHRVLVVDNQDKDNLFLQNLSIPNTRIIYETALIKALDQFKANPDDTSVIFMDVSRKTDDKEEFARCVRDNPYGFDIPLIGINGSEDSLYPGMHSLIQKPYSIDDFESVVHEMNSRRE